MKTLSLRLVLLLISTFPPGVRSRAIQWLSWLRYRRYYGGNRPQARHLRERLSISAEEAERLLQRWYELELLGILDGLRLRTLTADAVDSLIEIRGLDRLDRALAAGRGAVLTSGHHDGLTLFFAALGLRGYRPHLPRLRTRDRKGPLARWVYERYNAQLERAGVTTVWIEPGGFSVAVRMRNALRRNAVVASPIDLSQSQDNAIVEFLGARAPFPRGLAMLAKANDAPLLDFFVYRESSGRLVSEIGASYTVTDVDAAVQHSAARLEAQVRRHPADWSPWHIFEEWQQLEPVGAALDGSTGAAPVAPATTQRGRPSAGA